MWVFINPTSQALSMMSWGQVPSLSYSQATLRISFSAKLCASSRRSFCSSVRVKSTTAELLFSMLSKSVPGAPPAGAAFRRLTGQSTSLETTEWPRAHGVSTLVPMASTLAMTATQNGAVLVVIVAVAVPIAAFLFARSGEAWRSIGKGPFAIEPEAPSWFPRRGAAEPVDPAIQAAEVRQMLEAKDERRRRRGEAPLDVEAETTRLLAKTEPPAPGERLEAELREEVRQLVVSRNERRLRQGLEPLDVEKETERQLADFVGSR